MDEVLITGLGVMSCVGNGAEALWRGMQAATSAPVRVADPLAHVRVPLMHVAAEDVQDTAALDGAPLGRASRLARIAAREATADAALPSSPGRTPVVMGTGMGDAGLAEDRRAGLAPAGDRWSSPFAVAAAVADAVDADGPVTSISNACAASGFSLDTGADLIRTGEADVVVAGGAEGYSRVALACFDRLRALDPVRCRPFDLHRRGTIFGEGAAVFVLESASHARSRGATAYARLAGSGWSCDAYHATAPEPSGSEIVRAMRAALDAAGATSETVGCVVPHGTGTALNDVVESQALNQTLGVACDDVPLYSLKALLGHTGGAAGALAVAAATLIAAHGTVPANVETGEQDPECKVWLPRQPVPLRGRHLLVNAYAFGGNNVSLVLEGIAS